MQNPEKQILTKLKVQYYRGFFEEQSLNFGIPNGKPGSGMTLIVGPNNAGKTSVLEALLQIRRYEFRRFEKSDRHGSNKPKISIFFYDPSSGDCRVVITNKDKGSFLDYTFYNHQNQADDTPMLPLEAVTSRRHWSISGTAFNSPYAFSHNLVEFGEKITNNMKPRSDKGDHSETFKMLSVIRNDKNKKDKLDEMLKTLIPGFTDWDIDSQDSNDYLKYVTVDGEHRADLLGDGTLSLFRICLHLVDSNNKAVLIIDEPELSLHPVAQTNLSKLISKASKNKQIIVCTHSPYFVNWSDYLNGASFARLNKINDQACVISELDRQAKYTQMTTDSPKNWKQPYLMDTASKEIMFTSSILFVEGPEDVGLMRKWLKDNQREANFNIFGYGVGGFGNMEKLVAMAKDLKIERVAALYDKGAEESSALSRIKQEFSDSDNFKFFQLPTDDIRDKFVCPKCEKPCSCDCKKRGPSGCFDESGEIKPEYKQHFESIMEKIIKHLTITKQ